MKTRPDLKVMLVEELERIAGEEEITGSETGFALACLEDTSVGIQTGEWEVFFICPNSNGATICYGPLALATLYDDEQEAEARAEELKRYGPFRIVHLRRFPPQPTVIFGHQAIGALNRLAEV